MSFGSPGLGSPKALKIEVFLNNSRESGWRNNMRRLYESTFIVNAALEDSDIEAVVSKVTSYIENQGGTINKADKWGRRRLAYPINKKFNGFYVYIEFDADPAVLPVIERFFVLEDTILRHLTLQLPQELKDLRERKAKERGDASGGFRPLDDDAEEEKKKGRKNEKSNSDKTDADEEKNDDTPEKEEVKEESEKADTKEEANEEKAEEAPAEENNEEGGK